MPRPPVREEDQIVETWEIAFPGTVWVWIWDRREDGYKKVQVGQRTGSKSLHITRDDRKYNQELIPEENTHLDPFTNGQLRLLGAADRDENLDTRYHYSNEDLVGMFEVRDPALFASEIEDIGSEVILRRMYSLADEHATVAQMDALRDLLQKRYPIGGTQRTVREMYEAGERIGAQRI